MRRSEEVGLFLRGVDPYTDPDMTYPPSAPPVFTALIAVWHGLPLRAFWLVVNYGALAVVTIGIVRLWGGDWSPSVRWAFGLACAASKPVRLGIGLGQFHLVPLAFLVMACWALRGRRGWLSGLFSGLALVKPTMALPMTGVTAIRREWTPLIGSLTLQALLIGVTCSVLRASPIRLLREWITLARGQEAAGLIDVPSLLGRLGIAGALAGLAVLVLGTIAIGMARERSELGRFALTCFVAAIFTYHRPYDLVLLLPALAYLVDSSTRGRLGWPVTIAFGAALIVPTDPKAIGPYREVMEGVFVVVSYAMLSVCGVLFWRERAGVTTRR